MSDYDYYDPYAHRNGMNRMTNIEAFISLIKGAIGTGCLAMPMAFCNAGWLNGLFSTFFIGSIIIYALHILLHGMYELCKRQRVPILTYPEAMTCALNEGPPFLRRFRGGIGYLVDIFMAICQFGICCVYVVFIASSIKQIVDYYIWGIDERFYMLMLIIPLILIFLIRDLKQSIPFSFMANILLVFGFCAVFYYIFDNLPHLSERHAFNSLQYYPFFFGTILFAIESVGVIIAIESYMKTPKDYLGWTGILNCGMFTVIIFYAMFGFFGYWRYGDDIEPSITLNIPATQTLPQLIKIMFAIAIYFTYALQGYIAIDVLWGHYMSKRIEENELTMEYILRTCIVLASVLVGVIVPNLTLCLTLVGGYCLSTLGLTFPAILDICVHYKSGYGPGKLYLWRSLFIVLVGVLGSLASTRIAILQILALD